MTANVLIGTVLHGSYRITRQIEEGGMGMVYEAENVRLSSKRFAVKVLRASVVSQDPEAYARFRQEAEIVSKLGHPNIVDVMDFNITDDGAPYMVMELLRGEDLGSRLDKQKMLRPEEAVPIFVQVGAALQVAHDQGIVHRDLKPKNIYLVNEPGNPNKVKLLDFGISKLRHSSRVLTRHHSAMGTPHFMSPEQAEGVEIDPSTDIFALATTIYVCLSGKHPFDAPTEYKVLNKVCNEDPTPITEVKPELPQNLDRVLSWAHAKKKADRYQRVDDFVNDMALALGGVKPTGASVGMPMEDAAPKKADAPKKDDGEAPAEGKVDHEDTPERKTKITPALVPEQSTPVEETEKQSSVEDSDTKVDVIYSVEESAPEEKVPADLADAETRILDREGLLETEQDPDKMNRILGMEDVADSGEKEEPGTRILPLDEAILGKEETKPEREPEPEPEPDPEPEPEPDPEPGPEEEPEEQKPEPEPEPEEEAATETEAEEGDSEVDGSTGVTTALQPAAAKEEIAGPGGGKKGLVIGLGLVVVVGIVVVVLMTSQKKTSPPVMEPTAAITPGQSDPEKGQSDPDVMIPPVEPEEPATASPKSAEGGSADEPPPPKPKTKPVAKGLTFSSQGRKVPQRKIPLRVKAVATASRSGVNKKATEHLNRARQFFRDAKMLGSPSLYANALKEAKEVLKIKPRHKEAMSIATACRKKSVSPAAAPVVDMKHVKGLLGIARQALSDGKMLSSASLFNKARSLAREVLKLQPKNSEAAYIGGAAACHLKKKKEARRMYKRLLSSRRAKLKKACQEKGITLP